MSNATAVPEVKREDLRLVLFPSFREVDKARLLFSEDKEFEKIPWDESPTPISFITTAEAVSLLEKKGIKPFLVAEPVAKGDITRQQRKYLEMDRAVWAQSRFLGKTDVTFFLERISFGREMDGGLYAKTKKA